MNKKTAFSGVVCIALIIVICIMIKNNINDESMEEISDTTTITDDKTETIVEEKHESEEQSTEMKEQIVSHINPEGMTLETRISVPEGYTRISQEEGSLGSFIRSYGMKEDGAKVLLYDGTEKGNQRAQAAVFTLPLEARDLQQCADSVMRMYAEYFLSTEQYDKIAFQFTNGFLAEYTKWRDGYRIVVDGNNTYWSLTAGYDDSYECFQDFMRMVFAYAGTLSMQYEATEITMAELRIGDVFLYSGSPGHVVMVVDICEDANGKKAFLLAQGFMPAQEFHVLRNPNHENDPWYYEDEVVYPFVTPQYTFSEGSLKRLEYMDE